MKNKSNFTGMLLEDVQVALTAFRETSGEAAKRNLVRTAYSAIEGAAWIFREHVVDALRTSYGLTPDEEAFLADLTYSVSAAGKISSQPRYMSTLTSIRLVSRISERVAPSTKIDFSESGWAKLQAATALRNRLTHPKAPSDLDVSETEAEDCIAAMFWLFDETSKVMEATNTAVRTYLGEFRYVLSELKSLNPEMLALYEKELRDLD